MPSRTALFVALLFIVVSSVQADDAILHLSQGNFTNATDDQTFILLFYSPYCGHCNHFKPTWEAFANEIKGGPVKVGSIDCTKEHFLEGQFGIRGYPTVFFLKDGIKYEFGRDRTVAALKEFINGGYLKATSSPAPEIVSQTALSTSYQSDEAARLAAAKALQEQAKNAAAKNTPSTPAATATTATTTTAATTTTPDTKTSSTTGTSPQTTKNINSLMQSWSSYFFVGICFGTIGVILLFCKHNQRANVAKHRADQKGKIPMIEVGDEMELSQRAPDSSRNAHSVIGVDSY